MDKFKIVADSSADLFELEKTPFSCAPLRIVVGDTEYIDNEELDVCSMVETLLSYKGKSSTSCPSAGDWLKAFGDANFIFCLPITASLSGSYNSAVIAKNMYEELYPDRKVYVFDTLTTGPELKLLIEKIEELIEKGNSFEEICAAVDCYKQKTGLIFVLKSMKNLANNGRVNPIAAKAAGLLGIRALGKASDKGDLEMLDKCRGREKTLASIIGYLKKFGVNKGKIRITHCFNMEAAEKLKELIISNLKTVDIEIHSCTALCSFYAEKGGLLVGYEKF